MIVRRAALIALAGFLPLSASRAADAPAATTQASPAPGAPAGDAPDAQAAMRQAFADLADSDAAVREAARAELMRMERRYLPDLLKLVEQSRPVQPSQAAVLRQIVTHVYLAGEPYDSDPESGFLGVKLNSCTINLEASPPGDGLGGPRMGVVIVERIPGFVGNRLLLDGDVIIGIAEKQDAAFELQIDFTETVRSLPPGEPVHFQVLRHGRLIKIPIALDPRPHIAGPRNDDATEMFLGTRKQKAEVYWRQTFGRALAEAVG